eukprot:638899-Pleurochrysis_carterae.AAC.1
MAGAQDLENDLVISVHRLGDNPKLSRQEHRTRVAALAANEKPVQEDAFAAATRKQAKALFCLDN